MSLENKPHLYEIFFTDVSLNKAVSTKFWKSLVSGAGRNRSRLRSALSNCSCFNFSFVEWRQIDLVRTDWEKTATPLLDGTLVVATAARCKHRDGPRWPISSTFCPPRWRRITRRWRGGCVDRARTEKQLDGLIAMYSRRASDSRLRTLVTSFQPRVDDSSACCVFRTYSDGGLMALVHSLPWFYARCETRQPVRGI